MKLNQQLDFLIDAWCERRALRPLQLLLRAYPGSLVHSDQLFELLDALKDVKGLTRSELTEAELRQVIELINSLEEALKDGK